jgi:uncharacterized protein
MLRQQLSDDMKTALKAGDKQRLGTIRLVISEMKKADIATAESQPLDDAGIAALMGRMLKQRRDSVEQFVKGGREDLAVIERAEMVVIEAYLPKQMSDAEAKTAIAAVLAQSGVTSVKDMGKVMGLLKTQYAGLMDFGKASGMIKDLLK